MAQNIISYMAQSIDWRLKPLSIEKLNAKDTSIDEIWYPPLFFLASSFTVEMEANNKFWMIRILRRTVMFLFIMFGFNLHCKM